MEYPTYRGLMDVNVCSRKIRNVKKLLIYGTCVRDEYPEIFSKFSKDRIPLAVCLEKEHFNMVALKLASLVARLDLEELVVLTVDGSPHCVQLHMVVEEVAKITRKLKARHFVIEEGKAIEVSEKAVKTARYLSRIQKLLNKASL